MREVSETITQLVDALRIDYPTWQVDPFTPESLEEPTDTPLWVVIAPGEMTKAPEDKQRLLPHMVMNLEITARLSWRIKNVTSFQLADLFDVGASLLSWGRFRYLRSISNALEPISATPILKDSPVNDMVDPTRFFQILTWQAELIINPTHALEGPVEEDLSLGPVVQLPLTEFWVDGVRIL